MLYADSIAIPWFTAFQALNIKIAQKKNACLLGKIIINLKKIVSLTDEDKTD